MLLSYYKLPDQEDFILELRNNNYSDRTVYNYGRDLSIFARFIDHSGYKFAKIDKKALTLYKGYLRRSEHLIVHEKDKNLLEEELKKLSEGVSVTISSGTELRSGRNVDIKGKVGGLGSKGSKTHEKDMEEYQRLLKVQKMMKTRPERAVGISGRSGHRGLGSRSVNRMLSAIRSYLKWRIDFDLSVPVPPEALRLIKTGRKKSQVAELKELIAFIEAPSKFEKDIRVAARNRAMLELLFSTGMRISELVSLNMDMINQEGKIFIMGKGKKERFVYLTNRARHYLMEYLKVRENPSGTAESVQTADSQGSEGVEDQGESGDSEVSKGSKGVGTPTPSDLNAPFDLKGFARKSGEAVFIPYRGGRDGRCGSRISTNYLQEKIAEYRRRLGIVVPTSAHSLRHGFATYLAENGASPAAIQILLGHESLQTTTRYVHASDRFAEETHKEKHPLK